MATRVKTIGSLSRDYATFTLWEQDLDDGTNAANDATAYASGDDAEGHVYDDSPFDESFTINGGGTVGLNSITLTVPAGERHDGTGGTGARITNTAGSITLTIGGNIPVYIEWLELDGTDQNTTGILNNQPSFSTEVHLRNLLIHDIQRTGGGEIWGVRADTRALLACNLFIFGIKQNRNSGTPVNGIEVDQDRTFAGVINCTVVGCEKVHASAGGTVYGVTGTDLSTGRGFINNLSGGHSVASGTATIEDYASYSTATFTTNMSEDSSGSTGLTGADPANQFVSTTPGDEDLHLKSGADAIDAGTDQGTTPSGVEIDIDGTDRDATGATWDCGAHEFLAAGGRARRRRRMPRALLAA